MRNSILVGSLALTIAAGASAQEKDLSTFSWLAGAWDSRDGARTVEEIWTSPTANSMIGMSRTIADGKTIEFEFLRIEKRDGELFYVPQPNGRPPIAFRLTSSDGRKFVFENTSGEDRVNRIEYRRDGDDGVVARVEGTRDGKPFALEYRYRRRK